jgi:hypothetical protein
MLEKDLVKFQKKLLGVRGGFKCGEKNPDEIATSIRGKSQSI